MAEMEVSPQEEMANPQGMKVFAVERYLEVGACLKVNTRALGRGVLHKKGGSIPLLLTSEEIGAEHAEGPSLDQYERSSIPIIYIPNPFYQMTVQYREPSTYPKQPPTRYEILSQKLFMNCQVKRQYIKIPNPRIIHHSNPNKYLNKSSQSSQMYSIFRNQITK